MHRYKRKNKINSEIIISFFSVILIFLINWNFLPLWSSWVCKNHRQEASERVKNGNYVILLPDTTSWYFQEKFNSFLIFKLGNNFSSEIKYNFNRNRICYYKYLDSVFIDKFGENFLYEILKEKEKKDKTLKPRQGYFGEYMFVDTFPEFNGGNDLLKKKIIERIESSSNSIKGFLALKLIIGTTGKIEKKEIVRGVSPEIDSICLKAISEINESKYWKPGYVNGEKVVTQTYLIFKLEEKEKNTP